MTRRIISTITGFLLLAGLVALWSVRYQRLPGSAPISLGDIRKSNPVPPAGVEWREGMNGPSLKLVVRPGEPRAGWKVELPEMAAIGAVRVRIRLVARNLTLGPQEWDDGRVLIEWRPQDGTRGEETDPVCSVRDSEDSGRQEMVVRTKSGEAIPVLWVEHLGKSGELELVELELVPVRQSGIWNRGCWVLASAWFVWLVVLILPAGKGMLWKSIVSSAIWLGMAMVFAFPGPWKTLRPFVIPFDLGPENTIAGLSTPSKQAPLPATPDHPAGSHAPTATKAAPKPAPASETLGRIPVSGGWIIRAKQDLALLRPLIHALLLAGPSLVFSCLLGRRMAVILAASLSLAIEAAQTGFGFGFDWVDVFDLLTDASGILLGLWIHRLLALAKSSADRNPPV